MPSPPSSRASRALAAALLTALATLAMLSALSAAPVHAAGPPFPPQVPGQGVYDTAAVLSRPTIDRAEAIIRGIAQRTAAQVVVYTQVKPESDTQAAAEADARALIDQWGLGRRGFDDSLVILLDLDSSRCHGQAQLFAGAGFRATFLTDAERQAIFDDRMVPHLRTCDLDGAVLAALDAVDTAATPQNAARLQGARQLNAVIGVGGVVLGILLIGWWLWNWLRYGRDPVYLDDPSIYMPAPPPRLTAATAALLLDGQSTRHALTTALLDLASRGELVFLREGHFLRKATVSIQLTDPDQADPKLALTRRRPVGEAETYARAELAQLASDEGTIGPQELLAFGAKVKGFDARLEDGAVAAGWYGRAPRKVIGLWRAIGVGELLGAGLAYWGATSLPSDGLTLLAVGLAAAGVVTLIGASWMPAVTQPGSMVRAWLQAYRRTLEKTLEQSRSLAQVADSHVLPWVETPDQALVWGVALGLHREVEEVLQRSLEDEREGRAGGAWYPAWYTSGASSGSGAGGGPASGQLAPGLMAGSAFPSFSGMFSALGTIGNSPSSSGGGGGSSSGGGGAGGSF